MVSGAIQAFQDEVWDYYGRQGRGQLPWRVPRPDGSFDAYAIMVSEIMLQQTQVARVIPKFTDFMTKFPTLPELAAAELGSVLTIWSGLGYNRRAKFLWQAAQLTHQHYGDVLPTDQLELTKLPGIGINTAGAILAYAYDQPVVFVETNIRTVFIHHFFNDQTGVDDKHIRELVAATLPTDSARQWYWALMDYGSFLKQTVGNPNRASKHYAKQSKFAGSRRQLRGQILKLLSTRSYSLLELAAVVTDERLMSVVEDLVSEQLIQQKNQQLSL